MTRDLEGFTILSIVPFKRNGVEVVEYLMAKNETAEPEKLLWVREGLEKTVVEGMKNPVVHMDGVKMCTMDIARRKIAELFDRYWENPELAPTPAMVE